MLMALVLMRVLTHDQFRSSTTLLRSRAIKMSTSKSISIIMTTSQLWEDKQITGIMIDKFIIEMRMHQDNNKLINNDRLARINNSRKHKQLINQDKIIQFMTSNSDTESHNLLVII